MWRQIQSTWANVRSYADLRPDFQLRSQVNRGLGHRPVLSVEDWFERFWRSRGIAKQVVTFVYGRLSDYSGLCWGQIVPSDRLIEDLKFPSICWFDWELALCDDFAQEFGVDLGGGFDLDAWTTVEDLLALLNRKVAG